MTYFTAINRSLATGEQAALVTITSMPQDDDFIGRKALYLERKMVRSEYPEELAVRINAAAMVVMENNQSGLVETTTAEGHQLAFFVHSFIPGPRLIILGGGHVGAALCRMAALLDYRIILVDDRPAFASPKVNPDAHQLICDRFDLALDELEPTPADYIVIVTRGHQHDRLCLEKSLKRKRFAYIGMIGSHKRVRAQLEDLAAAGFSREEIEKIHSPIGLSIGAITEPEIALSILAEITAVRRRDGKAETAALDVLRELERLEKAEEQAALVTVVATMGSTPRKSGSQMIVYPDGSLRGTIGGGCSEADARREALLQLQSGKPSLFRQRLTADAAAAEGMACGGIMDLLIEPLLRAE
jgi:xanthine dehydrogenase accessory factor